MYNDDTNWENGAFNVNTPESGHPDYGWGTYSMTTHFVTGDSLFIIQLPDNKFRKLWIVQKNPILNQYTFKYANLDGSDENDVTVNCNDYAEKNFIGYSFAANDFVDREPASSDWDLVFTKYITWYGGVAWYPVTGILQNYNVQAATYAHTDTSFMDYSVSALDSATISSIGNNWYSLQGGMPPTYAITDSLVYFVSDQEKSIWKLVFDYYQSSFGDIGFKKQLIEDHTSISEIQIETSGNLALQPNPALGNTVDILFSADESGLANLSIYSISGAKMIEQSVNYTFGLNKQQIDISKLPSGAYIVKMTSGNVSLTNKLIIR
jgi:hypothetical protein